MSDWTPYFAWWPVWVDAYSVGQIKNGKMRYRKWGWVECRFFTWIDADDEPREHGVWRYRLKQEVPA